MPNSISFDRIAIDSLEKKYRIALINSISGFKSASLIGTCNSKGQTNLAIFNSVVHIGANPPLLGFILRPTTVPRHTYQNILDTGYYTINHIHQDMIENAHQTGAKYDEAESEFEKCGFNTQYYGDFNAPFVAESRVKLGMRFKEELPIKSNGTYLIIGEIVHILIDDETFLDESGALDLGVANTVAISGLDSYFSPQFIKKMPIPRP
jgi:flavin reductase (DIM6/NTAB) family NADH-FMN oxidoreductase RutF